MKKIFKRFISFKNPIAKLLLACSLVFSCILLGSWTTDDDPNFNSTNNGVFYGGGVQLSNNSGTIDNINYNSSFTMYLYYNTDIDFYNDLYDDYYSFGEFKIFYDCIFPNNGQLLTRKYYVYFEIIDLSNNQTYTYNVTRSLLNIDGYILNQFGYDNDPYRTYLLYVNMDEFHDTLLADITNNAEWEIIDFSIEIYEYYSSTDLSFDQYSRTSTPIFNVYTSTDYPSLDEAYWTYKNYNLISTDEYSSLYTNYVRLQSQYNTLNTNYQNLQTQYNTLNTDYLSLLTDYSILHGQYGSLETDYNILQSDYNTLNTNYQTLQSQYNTYVSEHSYTNTEYSTLNNNYLSLQTQYNTLYNDYGSLNNLYTNLSNDYSTLQTQYTNLYNEFETYVANHSYTNEQFQNAYDIGYNDALERSSLVVASNYNIWIASQNGSQTQYDFTKVTELDSSLYIDEQGFLDVSSIYSSYITGNNNVILVELDNPVNVINYDLLFNSFATGNQTNIMPHFVNFSTPYTPLYLCVNPSQYVDEQLSLMNFIKYQDSSVTNIMNYQYDAFAIIYLNAENVLSNIKLNGLGDYNLGYLNGLEQNNLDFQELKDDYATLENDYEGLNTRFEALQQQYNTLSNSATELNLRNLFWYIASTPFESFKSIWNVDFLGLNIASFFMGLFSVFIIIWILRKIF